MPPPPPPPPPPPHSLPPLRPPLPSLFHHRQTQQQRDTSAETHVPPLRWRRNVSETERLGDSHRSETHARASPVVEDERVQSKRKRLREVVATDTGHMTETSFRAPREDPSRAKKPVHQLQREERQELLDEALELAAQIEQLRRRAGLPTDKDKAALDGAKASNVDMEDKLRRNHLYLGRLHSMLTNELLLPTINTMSTFIHLPKDMDQRRAILRSIQEAKLRRGIEVAMERFHHLDHLVPYLSEERFISPSGEYHWQRFTIHQFPNFKTARQFFDVNVKFFSEIEINVTEMLRQVTLREDTDDLDPTIWNHRIITVAEDVGCTEEMNSVSFAQFYNHSPYTNSPMGVIVYDTVNIDDLYPYVPEERTCKDYQSVSLIYEAPKPGTNETVVVLKYCGFAVQLVPQFALPLGALKQLQDNTSRWPNAILKFLQEYDVTKNA